MQIDDFLAKLAFCTMLVTVLNCDALQKGICFWKAPDDGCLQNEFRCSNGTCIDRGSYCDGVNDCEDDADEDCFPDYEEECSSPELRRCELSNKCIPAKWFCDDVQDCDRAEDEKCDELLARQRALYWLKTQRLYRSPTNVWGSSLDRIAVAFHLGDYAWRLLNDGTRFEMAYELSIQLLSKLTQNSIENIPSYELASYVNAFLVTCLNPRNFHGVDIVQELRNRVDRQNYTNPYLFIALCNAGEDLTESDIEQLLDAFEHQRRPLWTDVRALVIMALACANRKTEKVDLPHLSGEFLEEFWSEATDNMQTKALVMQALISANYIPHSFNETEDLFKMIGKQDSTGSFGNIMNTYYMLPVLNCQSLVNIGSDHCDTFYKNDSLTLDSLDDKGPLVSVSYSIWLGEDSKFARSFGLMVPANTTLFKLMQHAADLDGHRIEYALQSGKPYINAVYGKQDDPEKGKFWFLYTLVGESPVLIHESPVDVTPQDKERYILWYRDETWTE